MQGPLPELNNEWLNRFAAERGFFGDAVYATTGEAEMRQRNEEIQKQRNQNQANNQLLKYDALTMGLSSIGLIGGVLFAMHRKSGV